MQRLTLWFGLCLLTTFAMTHLDALADRSDARSADKALWVEDFDGLGDNHREDKGDTAWKLTVKDPGGHVGTKNDELVMEYLLGEAVWTSEAIDISSTKSVKVAVDVRGEGSIDDDLGTEDHFRVYAAIDGGEEVLLGKLEGYLEEKTYTLGKGGLKGKSLVLVIRAYNTGDDEIWVMEKVSVEAE